MDTVTLFLFIMITSWQGATSCDHYHDEACLVKDPLEGRHFLNQWIVHVEGGPERARSIAEELGFEYMKEMRTHDNHYFFRHPTDVPHRHKMKHKDVLGKLKSHEDIISSDQQYVFELTLNEIDNFEDMVGHSEPRYVKFTHFNPDNETDEREESAFVRDRKNRKTQDVEIIYEDDRMPNGKFEVDGGKLSDLDGRTDFQADYAKRKEEIENLDQQVDNILEKLERLK